MPPTAGPRQAQRFVELVLALQLLNAFDAKVPRAQELFARQAVLPIRGMELFDAAAHGPLRLERGKDSPDLAAIDAIATRVGSAARGVLHLAAGDDLFHHVGHFADAVILLTPAHVERLVVDRLTRRVQHGEESPSNVLGMDEWPPRSAVALNQDLASRVSKADEAVHDQVHPQTRRDAVSGGVAQIRRAKTAIRQLGEVAFGSHLGFAVRSDGIERRLFVDRRIARHAIQAARGRIQEARHPGLAGNLGQPNRGAVVDVVGAIGVQIAQRVVGQGCEVDDGVKALQLGTPHVAQIGLDPRDFRRTGAEYAALKEPAVEADDRMPRSLKHRHHDGAEITRVAGNQHFH